MPAKTMPKITDEKQLVEGENVEALRASIIECFNSPNNTRRKDESFKAYECLKDKTSNYVMDLLTKQFDANTVVEMQYAISNISILRKIIDKLAKVYANGVKRTGATDKDTKALEEAAEYLKMDSVMKKTNRYYRTFWNTLTFVRPMKNTDASEEGKDLYDIKVEVLPPFKYDAVEDGNNPERAIAIVLSDYAPTRRPLYAIGDAATANRQQPQVGQVIEGGTKTQSYTPGQTGITQGDGGAGEDKKEYVWWTKNYHFTTNAKGTIIASYLNEDGSTDNPIKKMPFVNFAGDQDGCFWAEGGEDLVDTGIKINVDISNVKHIGSQQGYGQLYMTGKNLPKSVKVGPTHCIQLEQSDKDEPAPTIGILSSNPPLADLKALIEMQVALMLSTNNLSTSGFSVSLSGGKDFASGIAMMIDKSESIEDIDDQAKVFIEREPLVWVLVYAWLDAYRSSNSLTEEAKVLKQVKKPEDVDLAFPSPKPVVSESDELDVLQKRKDLGLNTEIELLMRDDPSLTEEAAAAKLEKIKTEKEANLQNAADAMTGGDGANGNPGQESGGLKQPDNNNPGLNGGAKDPGKSQDPNQA